ncbi:MAG: hypothetical protein IJU65_06965 [Desulfovibrio sp.]|nr:hypothetical protein [Desulfovibrio sp.]
MRSIALFLCVCALCIQTLPAGAAVPDTKKVQVILDRLVLLYETTGIKAYDAPDEAVLDTVALKVFPHDSSPAAAIVAQRSTHPELFTKAAANENVALHRDAVALIARYFLGRKAKLATIKEDYIFGTMRVAPRWCYARFDGMDTEENNQMLLHGALLCEETVELGYKRMGTVEAHIAPLDHAPLGWAVERFRVTVDAQ